ncbi:MAG: 23S rRNA methyltransferase [Methylococcales bacterium]|nr:23S rRNA methyltransferase [Methylococcales bacterium]MBT7410831.1 23S rRNA methyltransferase [Methylococcales bacterium]
MKKNQSKKSWIQAHVSDEYVKKSKALGYRSRASFKLLEIQEKDHIIKYGMNVVDLGATPGGWSEAAVKIVGEKGSVYALDLLPLEPIPDVIYIQGDFTDDAIYEKVLEYSQSKKIELVMSDMSPNLSGIKDVDQAKIMYLAELVLDFSKIVLVPGGSMLVKLFQGEGIDDFYRDVRKCFKSVKTRKPKASRPKSREIYLLAKDYFVS